MIYVCAGLYAEGPTDYRFLGPLITRLIYDLSAAMVPGRAIVADTVGIDAPRRVKSERREDRIAAAIDDAWGQCTLFIVHSDGAGDPVTVRRSQVDPGIERARAGHPDLASAACIPVRELEAWMLVDDEPFRILGAKTIKLPEDPESDLDPKATLRRLFKEIGVKPQMLSDSYRLFGENIRVERLDRLPAFVAFRTELAGAITAIAAQAQVEARRQDRPARS
jgi:hypothetical protein